MKNELKRLQGLWRFPTDVHFGVGRIASLPEICKSLEVERPLLVTDPGLAALPMVADAYAACKAAGLGIGLFSEVKSNPVERNVVGGTAAFRAGRHDGIIAFGGGSALDTGKAIGLTARQDVTPLWAFDVADPGFKRDRFVDVPPIIAVPTTAGTGSEVGRAAVVTDEKTHTKRILINPRILPRAVIADPALTAGLPRRITAATGMDALAHNLEAYCCDVEYHPLADGIALEGIRLVKEWLPVAVADGANLTARSYMLAAASMGAVAFQKGLGAIHALSHPVGALLDTHHGLTNAVFMPYVVAFNRPAIEERMERLARYLRLTRPTFTAVINWIIGLRGEIGLPHTADELGVGPDNIEALAEMAAADPCAAENPVPVGVAELRKLYQCAVEGDLP